MDMPYFCLYSSVFLHQVILFQLVIFHYQKIIHILKIHLDFYLNYIALFCLYYYNNQNLGKNQYFRNVKSE